MHIPDGFINGATSAGAAVVAAGAVGAALRKSGQELQRRMVPMAGLVAAFVFALQMLNFPVAAGTSGHLLGGALAAVLLGPSMGLLAVTVVVVLQALVFADGGISALGLNVLNMAVVTSLVGWGAFIGSMAILRKRTSSVVVASFVAAAISVIASSIAFAFEYAIGGQGGAPVGTVFTAVAGVHTLIGLGEGLITAATVAAVLAVRPDLVFGAASTSWRRRSRSPAGVRWQGSSLPGSPQPFSSSCSSPPSPTPTRTVWSRLRSKRASSTQQPITPSADRWPATGSPGSIRPRWGRCLPGSWASCSPFSSDWSCSVCSVGLTSRDSTGLPGRPEHVWGSRLRW